MAVSNSAKKSAHKTSDRVDEPRDHDNGNILRIRNTPSFGIPQIGSFSQFQRDTNSNFANLLNLGGSQNPMENENSVGDVSSHIGTVSSSNRSFY